ncbi:uncharacterized protein LOC135839156 [Planococcus citri]|uniref:uncharacterized protein LOC135839156 n=1 Tax=Planococcus citri TaxID=170843 RepID=UPI0031F8FCFA
MDRRANVKWIYAIGAVLIITNAASGVGGDIPNNTPLRTECCLRLAGTCTCINMVKSSQYKFEHIFPIKTINDTVALKFNVKADRDANLQFYAEGRKLAYEIILGGRTNTLSNIKKKLGVKNWSGLDVFEEVEYAEYLFADVVSPNEWREFWVQIKDDTVKVGRKDENAFMELKNVINVPVTEYSAAGWGDNKVLWSLPCIQEEDFSW